MRINDAGRQIIERFEGCSLVPYRCPAGVLTIGYGHTGDVEPHHRLTQHQAETILEYDLERFERAVRQICPTANANQHSAMVSLCFNIGIEAFRKSTLVRRFNAGGPLAAANQFDKWVHGGGKVLPGLVKRRAAEKALFLEAVS